MEKKFQALIDREENSYAILSTAIIYIQYREGNFHECRALLDTGSQPHMITQDFCRTLNLPVLSVNMTVSGVEQIGHNVTKRTRAVIKSKFGDYETYLRYLVTSRITNYVPIAPKDLDDVKFPSDLQIADPIISNPRIDLLIDTGMFWDLLCVGQIRLLPRESSTSKNSSWMDSSLEFNAYKTIKEH